MFVVGDPPLGGGDGVAVVASPVAAPRFIEAGLAVGQDPLRVVSGPEDLGQLGAGVLRFAAPVGGQGGVELLDAGGGGGAGVAELGDPEGERILGPNAGRHRLGPVVVEPVAKPDQFFLAPTFGRLEALEGYLVAFERLGSRGDAVTCLPGGRRLLAIGRDPLFEVPALFSAPSAQPGERSQIVELPGGTDGKSLHGLKPRLRRA